MPSSRANSSKQGRLEVEAPGQSKRSRSASEEPWDLSPDPPEAGRPDWDSSAGPLEVRGSESKIHHEPFSSPSHQPGRPRRLTKVPGSFIQESILLLVVVVVIKSMPNVL